MFEGMLEKKQGSQRSTRLAIMLAAAALHALVLGGAVAQSYFAVPEIGEPPLLVEFLQAAPPPPPAQFSTAAGEAGPAEPEPALEPEVPLEQEALDFDVIAEPIEIATEIDFSREPDVQFRPPELVGDPQGVPEGVVGSVGTGSMLPGLGEPLRHPEVPARCINRVKPRYPELAKIAGLQGTVILEAIIREDGSVADIRVIREGPMGCTDSAIDAVRRWRYEPARHKGVPVTTILEVRVEFVLE